MQAAVLILQIGLQDERMDKVELLRGDKQARAARAALTEKLLSSALAAVTTLRA